MVLRSPELVGITIVENEDSIHVRTGHAEVGLELFNDGTYKKSKKWADSYSRPLKIQKGCPTCNSNFIVKGRTAGYATMNDKNSLCHAYSFDITTISNHFFTKDGDFTCALNSEIIKFAVDEVLYRVYTDFSKDSEIIKTNPAEKGLPRGNLFTTADFPQPKTMYMQLPPVKTDKIFNKEQMIDKINTYVLFS
jgi:hypothetical protein